MNRRFVDPELQPPGEQARSPLAIDLRPLLLPCARAWTALALLGLLAGLSWRLARGATPPELAVLAGTAGFLYWAAGWLLGEGIAASQARRFRHALAAPDELGTHLISALAQLGCAALLALAPVGVLLAYRPGTVLQLVQTLDPASFDLHLGFALVGILLSGGTAVALLSAAVAIWMRRLGQGGMMLWLGIGLLFNIRALAGAGESQYAPWVPPTLGSHLSGRLVELAQATTTYSYGRELLNHALLPPLLVCLGALVLIWLGLTLTLRPNVPSPRFAAWPAAGWGAAALVIARSGGALWHFSVDPALRYPGDWRALFLLAVAAFWLLLWLFSARGRQPSGWRGTLAAVAWPLLALGATIVCTLPNVRADQAGQGEVLRYALLWLPPLLAGGALIDLARRYGKQTGLSLAVGAGVVVAALAWLLIPLDGSQAGLLSNSIASLHHGRLPELQVWALWTALLLIAALTLAFGRLPHRRKSAVVRAIS